jgi:two-component system nitrogen regulation sensor histidine kinase NtrY
MAPEIAALMKSGADQGLVHLNRKSELTLAVRLTQAAGGWVITFEDITRQLLDQRQAAWSDVARRIAHEIKNPLTPIQLATERLNRRYRKQIEHDGELFDELTGTIIRQVGDLRKMVNEFSSFARLPKPVFRQEDAVDLVRQALFLQEVARPDIDFSFSAEDDMPPIACDRHQFGQAMTNVLKNAAEAIEAKKRDAEPDFRGRIAVAVGADARFFTVAVSDNGIGLPSQGAERILEPYVTTREKGTGLGLAIVKKIVEEHAGEMNFARNPGEGPTVTLRFARDPLAAGAEAAE